MRMRRTAALSLAFALSMGLAACGDDDDSGDDALEEVDDSSSDDSSDDSSSDDSDSGDDSDAGGDIGDLAGEGCVEFAQAFGEASAAIGGAFSGEGGQADFTELADFFEEAADDVPDEVGDALETLAGAYRQFGEALEDADIDFSDPEAFQDPEVIAAFTEASEAFESPEVQEANQTLEQFTANNCEG